MFFDIASATVRDRTCNDTRHKQASEAEPLEPRSLDIFDISAETMVSTRRTLSNLLKFNHFKRSLTQRPRSQKA